MQADAVTDDVEEPVFPTRAPDRRGDNRSIRAGDPRCEIDDRDAFRVSGMGGVHADKR